MTALCVELLADGLFAAVAAVGFSVISNPPRKAIPVAALLAALGHILRTALMGEAGLGIAVASFGAAFGIGMLSLVAARRVHCPAEVLSFPALLPMIPGMYAYKTVLSFMQFLGPASEEEAQRLIVDIFQNGLTALFTITALVVGAILPLFMFPTLTYTMTRIINPLMHIGHPGPRRRRRR